MPIASHLEGPLERGPIASSTLAEMNQEEPLERFFVCHPYPICVSSVWKGCTDSSSSVG